MKPAANLKGDIDFLIDIGCCHSFTDRQRTAQACGANQATSNTPSPTGKPPRPSRSTGGCGSDRAAVVGFSLSIR